MSDRSESEDSQESSLLEEEEREEITHSYSEGALWGKEAERQAEEKGRVEGNADAAAGRVPWKPIRDTEGEIQKDERGRNKIEFNQYEKILQRRAEQQIEAIQQEWKKKDATFKIEYCNALAKLAEKRGIEKKEQKLESSLEELKPLLSHHLPKEKTLWSKIVHWSIVAFLALVEVPLNAFAFRPFREIELFNYYMGFGMGVVLAACGHYAGKYLKEYVEQKDHAIAEIRKKGAGKLWLALVPIAVAASLTFALSYMRKEYLQFLSTQMSPLASLFIFWVIGMGIAFAVGYFTFDAHEGNPDVYQIEEKRKFLEKEIASYREQIEKEKKERELLIAQRDAEREKRVALCNETYHAIRKVIGRAIELMDIYRNAYRLNYEAHVKENPVQLKYLEMPKSYAYICVTEPAFVGEDKVDPSKLDWGSARSHQDG